MIGMKKFPESTSQRIIWKVMQFIVNYVRLQYAMTHSCFTVPLKMESEYFKTDTNDKT